MYEQDKERKKMFMEKNQEWLDASKREIRKIRVVYDALLVMEFIRIPPARPMKIAVEVSRLNCGASETALPVEVMQNCSAI